MINIEEKHSLKTLVILTVQNKIKPDFTPPSFFDQWKTATPYINKTLDK